MMWICLGALAVAASPSEAPPRRHLVLQATGLVVHGFSQTYAEHYALCGESGLVCLTPGVVVGVDRDLQRFEVTVTPLDTLGRRRVAVDEDDGVVERRLIVWSSRFWTGAQITRFRRTSAAVFQDSAGLGAGYVHLGWGVEMALGEDGRHALATELGPALYVRENWALEPWYTGEPLFGNEAASESFSWLMVPSPSGEREFALLIAPGIEYRYRFDTEHDRTELLVSFVPTVFTNALYAGVRVTL